ncbi:MAG TPA: patatin-like phospholipase family protein [Acetobacteraceae bacterium]|nr:patatin-like phospholipase family protein [Acetobacteraceae bacterium]
MTRLQALAAELAAIRAVEQPIAGESDLRKLAHRLGLSALCLSGGGIRSASFCLGVLQALASAKLLARFDYLSTVSGGGYIGSWLQTMLDRRGTAEAAEAALGDPDDPPVELLGLREYTNYLSPQGGLFSTDTWTGGVLFLRNVLLNWMVYLPLLLISVLLAIFYRTAIWTIAGLPRAQLALIAVGAVSVAAGTFFAARMIPDHRPRNGGSIEYAAPRTIALAVCLPAYIWAGLAPLSQGLTDEVGAASPISALLIAYWAALTAGYGMAWVRSWRARQGGQLYLLNAIAFGGASVVSTAVIGAGALLAGRVPVSERAQALAVLGPLWLMVASGIHSAVFVGLRRESSLFDLDREWLARVSALKLRAGFLWTVFAFCSLSLTWLLHQPASPPTWVAAVMTLASGSIAAWLGKQAGSQVGVVVSAISRSQRMQTLALNLLSALFIAGLLAVLGMVTDAALGKIQDIAAAHLFRLNPQWLWSPEQAVLVPIYNAPWLLFAVQGVALLLLLVAILWVNRRVNVNRYSLHAVYRNRLTRAFLGAARGPARRADPFTDFDPDDNLPLAALGDPLCQRRLFPVINLTLNLTAGGATAWSERKAMAFTATPVACGAPLMVVSGHPVGRGTDPQGVYVPTSIYAGMENPGADPAKATGISLATAMTISGAAVSPNWGYHSSTLTAFVMTLFNVRLGAWLPNPAAARTVEELRMAMPKRSLMSMLGDLLALSRVDRPAIYLSDGGHFENLGLYEMLRRRCRLILVIDAGEDAACAFEDLGNALRKAAIDMQITVEFDAAPRIVPRTDTAGADTALGFAVAKIHYPEQAEQQQCGRLVYLKPSLLPDLPEDVRAYANLHATFPHESTLEQFFTESQFESYRALGQFQMQRLIGDSPSGDLTALFATAGAAYEGPAAEFDTAG